MTEKATYLDQSNQSVLANVVDEITERLNRGESLEIEEYTAKYPHLEAPLHKTYAALVRMRKLAQDWPDLMEPASDVRPERQLGDFRILRELGRGGMGMVYEAEQISLSRRVALKVLPFAAVLDPRQLQRFKNEAQAAAMLKHPNIVSVYGISCERGVHHFAMELVEGPSLAHVIDRMQSESRRAAESVDRPRSDGLWPPADESQSTNGNRQSATCDHQSSIDTQPVDALSTEFSTGKEQFFSRAARLGIEAAEALGYAHEEGVVHRDIKPSNLLIDQKGKLWLTDFGLARLQGERGLTVTGDVVGTLRYMSPEQAAGRKMLDHRTDVYSLGITLYELLTLRPAFPEGDRQKLLRQISEDDPLPLRSVSPTVPKDLETIILKAIAKEPEARYGCSAELADDLRRFLDHKPIHARRVRPWERAWRWARRNRIVAVLATAVACLLIFVGVAGAVVALRQTRLAQEKHRVAETLRRLLYVSQVRNAYQAWEEANLTRVQDLLSRQPPDLRGFEWYHLSAELGRIAATPRLEHDSTVMAVAYSPDGNVLAVACVDGTVKLWDLGFRRLEPIATLRGHSDAATCVAFSPDGETLAVGSRDKSITVWQAATGQRLWKADTQCGEVRSLAYAPGGETLAANSGELVQLWDTATRQETSRLHGHTATINAMAFSRDGSLLASGGFDHTVRLWDVPSRTLKRELRHSHRVYTVAFSADGKTLASGGYNYEIRLWDVPTGDERETIRVVGHSPRTLAFSPDSAVLASGGRDNVVRLWHGRTGRYMSTIKGHSGELRALAFSPDGRTLAAGGHDRLVKLWELAERVPPQRDLAEGTWLTPICFLSNGRSLAASTGLEGNESARYKSGDLWILDVATGKKRILPNRDAFLSALAISPDGKYLVVGGKRGSSPHGEIQLWDLNTCTRLVELERRLDLQWSTGVVWSVAFSPDSAMLAVGGGGWPGPGKLKLWYLDGEQPPRTLRGDMGRVLSVAFSPDGRVLAVGGNTWRDTNLALWDVESGKRLAARVGHAEETPGYGTACVTLSPDGKLLASAGHDKAVMLWEMPSLSRRKKLTGHSRELGCVAFSPNGKTLASAGGDAKVKLWHVRTGGELATLKGRTGYFCVTFSPDGKTLAASDVNKTVTLWHASIEKQQWPVRLR